MTYITCDEVARKVGAMGRGTMMAKIDLKSAYRMVSVHPDDRKLATRDAMERIPLHRHLLIVWLAVDP